MSINLAPSASPPAPGGRQSLVLNTPSVPESGCCWELFPGLFPLFPLPPQALFSGCRLAPGPLNMSGGCWASGRISLGSVSLSYSPIVCWLTSCLRKRTLSSSICWFWLCKYFHLGHFKLPMACKIPEPVWAGSNTPVPPPCCAYTTHPGFQIPCWRAPLSSTSARLPPSPGVPSEFSQALPLPAPLPLNLQVHTLPYPRASILSVTYWVWHQLISRSLP